MTQLILLALLACNQRYINIKTIDQRNVDASIVIQQSLGRNTSFTLGFGHTFGSGWAQKGFGSGLAFSGLPYNVEYTTIRDYTWGKNGFNFQFVSTAGGISFQGGYTGYSDTATFSFSGNTGSFTGSGTIVMHEKQIRQIRTDIKITF